MTQEVANPEGSVGCSDGTVVDVCCEDKLRSLSEGEIKTLVEVSEDSIAKILGGPIVSERVVDESIRIDVVGELEERGREFLSMTSVMNAIEVGNVVDFSKLPSGSPLKRSTGVLFVISEEEELRCEVAQSGKKKNSKYGDADLNWWAKE